MSLFPSPTDEMAKMLRFLKDWEDEKKKGDEEKKKKEKKKLSDKSFGWSQMFFMGIVIFTASPFLGIMVKNFAAVWLLTWQNVFK